MSTPSVADGSRSSTPSDPQRRSSAPSPRRPQPVRRGDDADVMMLLTRESFFMTAPSSSSKSIAAGKDGAARWPSLASIRRCGVCRGELAAQDDEGLAHRFELLDEQLDAAARRAEDIMLALRMRRGLALTTWIDGGRRRPDIAIVAGCWSRADQMPVEPILTVAALCGMGRR